MGRLGSSPTHPVGAGRGGGHDEKSPRPPPARGSEGGGGGGGGDGYGGGGSGGRRRVAAGAAAPRTLAARCRNDRCGRGQGRARGLALREKQRWRGTYCTVLRLVLVRRRTDGTNVEYVPALPLLGVR